MFKKKILIWIVYLHIYPMLSLIFTIVLYYCREAQQFLPGIDQNTVHMGFLGGMHLDTHDRTQTFATTHGVMISHVLGPSSLCMQVGLHAETEDCMGSKHSRGAGSESGRGPGETAHFPVPTREAGPHENGKTKNN